MTLVLVVVAGIALALVVASVVAVLVTAALGAALAVVTVPYSLLKARLGRAPAETASEPVPTEIRTLEPGPQPVPIPVRRPASVWLRPAAVLAWAGVAVLLDLGSGQRGR